MVDRIIQEKSLFLQDRIFSNKGKNLLLKEQNLNHIEKGGKKETDRGASLELLSISNNDNENEDNDLKNLPLSIFGVFRIFPLTSYGS